MRFETDMPKTSLYNKAQQLLQYHYANVHSIPVSSRAGLRNAHVATVGMNDKMFTTHTMIEQPVLKSGGFRTLKESMIHKERPYS